MWVLSAVPATSGVVDFLMSSGPLGVALAVLGYVCRMLYLAKEADGKANVTTLLGVLDKYHGMAANNTAALQELKEVVRDSNNARGRPPVE